MKNAFKNAHEITKKIIRKGDSYKATFRLALSFAHSLVKKDAKTVEDTLIEKGYCVWENYGKRRIYMNNFIELANKFGIDFKKEKAYGINPKSFMKIGMYYDLDNNAFCIARKDDFMGKYVNRVIDAIRSF